MKYVLSPWTISRIVNRVKSKAFDQLEASLNKAEISMTPLIDMVFILLIFFVVTTTFTKETGIVVEKAKAATSEIINNDLFTIAVDLEGRYWHDSKEYNLDELVPQVVASFEGNRETNVVIIPDKAGKVEPLIAIMDRLREEEITRFSLGTERKSVQ